MNNKLFGAAVLGAAAFMTLTMSLKSDDNVISKEGQSTVINTTSLTKNVRGFKGATPVKIYVFKNKIQKVVALKNQETPQIFNKARTLLSKYEGKSVGKAAKLKVDAVSGATYSSKALIKNVQTGLDYYKTHK